MISENAVVKADSNLQSAHLDGEVVLLNVASGQYYGLNEIGARVLELIQEPRTVASVVEAMLAEYDVEREQLLRDVLRFVRQMEAHQMIEVYERAA